ncbi:MAG: type IV secretory system conjugative DNA transfer family protein [Lachnospiraceae bacterium]|nr:type IV secretory system conjugative DNA transfer family protein [Lachnospiraceae bacterium]
MKKRKTKKARIILFFSAVELLLSVWIASILHQILLHLFHNSIREMEPNLNYVYALHLIWNNPRVGGLWGLLQVFWLIALIYLTLSQSAKIGRVDTRMITPDIEKPVPAGNGQYGSERFLTEEEKENLFGVFVFSGEETLTHKGGLVVQMTKKKGKEIILYVKDDLHSLIIGASGSGKTRRILLTTIWLQLLSGLSVVVSDVKAEIYYFTNLFAKSLGYFRIVFDLRNPKKSMHYNFLQPILKAVGQKDMAKAVDYTWDLVSVLVGEQKGEPIWYNGECASIAAAILIVALDAPEGCKNLTNVYYFLAYMCEPDLYGEIPLNAYLKQLPDNHPARGVFQQAKIAPFKTRSSFYTSALGTLRLFTNPNIAEITSKSDFDLKDIGRRKTIFYMIIPDEKKTNYPLVSILITQLYMLQVELANENGLKVPIPTDYDIDELGNFPKIPVLPEIVSAGRSRGIRLNGIIQDYQQIEKKYKDDFKNIRANCQVKIYLKSDELDTLKNISESLGKYTVEVSSASTSVSDGNGSKDHTNYSSSANLAACDLLTPAEVKRIKPPYSICMVTGEYAGIHMLPDISQWRLNEIYGMGDQEYNTRLMIEREAERKEHAIPEPTLWGIWKYYQMQEEPEDNTGTQKAAGERLSFLK